MYQLDLRKRRCKYRFKLANKKLKINFYDAEIFEAVLKRLEAQKDSIQDSVSFGIKPGIKKEPAHDQDANVNPSEAFIPERHLTLRQRMREFSRFHGLPKRDAVFFNESDLLVDMAKKEDFVILGRCGDAIMANNNIPHISIYITAPFEQRIKRAMEIDSSLTVKQARHMFKVWIMSTASTIVIIQTETGDIPTIMISVSTVPATVSMEPWISSIG